MYSSHSPSEVVGFWQASRCGQPPYVYMFTLTKVNFVNNNFNVSNSHVFAILSTITIVIA
jgi:hypothetical protein